MGGGGEAMMMMCLWRGCLGLARLKFQKTLLGIPGWGNLFWREKKIEHRAIEFNGFIEAYYKTIRNIKDVSKKYKELITIDIAVKNEKNEVGKWLRNVDVGKIDDLVKVEYDKDKLIKYVLGAQNDTKADTN